MSKSTFVPLAFKNAFIDLEGLLPAVLVSPIVRREPFDRIAALYRRMGVASLLITADPIDFYRYLFRASRAYAYFAEHAAQSERVTSKAEAFFDAVACRDPDGATRIAAAMPSSVTPGREYEEDFHYVRLLMDFYARKPLPPLEAEHAAWVALADGNPDPRIALCGALLARDQGQFDAAIDEAIAARLRALAKRRERDALPADEAATTANVSVEVLAWLEIAEAVGLRVAPEYPLAPGTARAFDRSSPRAAESWQALP